MLYFARWKIVLVLAICVLGMAYAAPNLLTRDTADSLPGWMPNKQINLGLDLQGGSHMLLEVDVDAVIRERLESLIDSMRAELRKERIGYTGLGIEGAAEQPAVRVRIRDAADVARATELIRGLGNPVSPDLFGGGGGGVDIAVGQSDDGVLTVALSEAAVRDRKRSAVEQSIEIVRRRVDEVGTREPTIQRQGDERILVQLPGVRDPDRIKRLLGKTAKLGFRLLDTTTSVEDAQRGRIPPGSEMLAGPEGSTGQYVVRKRVYVSGENLTDAQPTYQDGRPVVSFRFDSIGAKRFGDVTKDNVGQPLAIVLDDRVISAPRINEPILGGSGIISGGFSVQEANDLAVLLRAGALPAPLTILEERTVGPDLGADSIRAGKIAGILAFLFVMVFMALAYSLFGVAADIALLVNMVLITAALSVLQATLTLPGIAGIVLTIGMAVDANVLIFERIREEIASGKTPFASVEAGYQRAMTTIVDANLTTLIAAVLLFEFGSGPVKGFAVTLAIGIVTSMFTAIVVTRLMVSRWLRWRRPTVLPV
jgi:preprotein translocase subunit SecD